ncbi:uncharacterized protein LOC120073222 isoform X3 [Benincasa hispida]|uniref:uncharacterized protein LOC120073222 isoform X3 n=1 Tax=Benincasa hispida TaxID=102211 RepID=UPI0019016D5F|nr:uncharacterized protein LOC120073222 isoform X3 [Benincasa hispida]
MDSATLTMSSSVILRNSSQKLLANRKIQPGLCFARNKFSKISAVYPNGSASGDLSSGKTIGIARHNKGFYFLDDDASSRNSYRTSLLCQKGNCVPYCFSSSGS